jgi:7-cyano-7-deazaguanine synthase
MKKKSIILLSGGLDSTVSATIAKKRTKPIFALTFDYGQRSAKMEILASRKICRALKIKHKVVKLPFFKEFKKLVMLKSKKLDTKKFNRLKDIWIPNRNGLFINIAACYAEYFGADLIITGFNREEARQFPDNTPQFVSAINKSLSYSTLKKIKVKSYVEKLSKKEIYELGLKYKAPLKHIYSCYLGGKTMCGKCASCRRLIECIE